MKVKLLDDYGNEERNEEGNIEFIEINKYIDCEINGHRYFIYKGKLACCPIRNDNTIDIEEMTYTEEEEICEEEKLKQAIMAFEIYANYYLNN